jgi:hypothetical protein
MRPLDAPWHPLKTAEILPWAQGVAGSNPVAPTTFRSVACRFLANRAAKARTQFIEPSDVRRKSPRRALDRLSGVTSRPEVARPPRRGVLQTGASRRVALESCCRDRWRCLYFFGGHPRARPIRTVDGLATADLLVDGIRPIYFIPHEPAHRRVRRATCGPPQERSGGTLKRSRWATAGRVCAWRPTCEEALTAIA